MKRRTLGILCLVVPISLIVCTLSLYAILSFILASVMGSSGEVSSATVLFGGIVRVILGALGLIAVFGIPLGIPIGIYLLCTQEKLKGTK